MNWAGSIQQLLSEGFFGAITLFHNGSQTTPEGLSLPYADLQILDDATQLSVKPSEQVLIDALARWQLADDALDAVNQVKQSAKTQALNIPAWADWTEAQAQDYIETNVTTLASAKVVLKAMARMLVALRNETWPDLQG